MNKAQAAKLTQAYNDGFNNAICLVLGYLNGVGENGSTEYEEILREVDEDRIIAYARKNHEMRFTGLDRYLRRKRR